MEPPTAPGASGADSTPPTTTSSQTVLAELEAYLDSPRPEALDALHGRARRSEASRGLVLQRVGELLGAPGLETGQAMALIDVVAGVGPLGLPALLRIGELKADVEGIRIRLVGAVASVRGPTAVATLLDWHALPAFADQRAALKDSAVAIGTAADAVDLGKRAVGESDPARQRLLLQVKSAIETKLRGQARTAAIQRMTVAELEVTLTKEAEPTWVRRLALNRLQKLYTGIEAICAVLPEGRKNANDLGINAAAALIRMSERAGPARDALIARLPRLASSKSNGVVGKLLARFASKQLGAELQKAAEANPALREWLAEPLKQIQQR